MLDKQCLKSFTLCYFTFIFIFIHLFFLFLFTSFCFRPLILQCFLVGSCHAGGWSCLSVGVPSLVSLQPGWLDTPQLGVGPTSLPGSGWALWRHPYGPPPKTWSFSQLVTLNRPSVWVWVWMVVCLRVGPEIDRPMTAGIGSSNIHDPSEDKQ